MAVLKVWNGSAWVKVVAGGGGISGIDDLTDVDTTGKSDQDQLKWDATAGQWVPFTPSSGSGANLTWTASTSTVSSDTGTDATLTAVDGSNPGLMSVADKSKLDGVAAGATDDTTADDHIADAAAAHAASAIGFTPAGTVAASQVQAAIEEVATDAAAAADAAKDRGTHTGSQLAATISDLSTAAYVPGGTDVPIADGGTGASTASLARINLEVTRWTSQNAPPSSTPTQKGALNFDRANNVFSVSTDLTGPADWKEVYRAGGTDVPIADGGTGQSTAAAAFSALKQDATTSASGVGEIATQGEVDTGTDPSRWVTPETLAGSALVAANTAKVTNATHTGDVTGSGALTVDPTAISGKPLVTAVGADHVLILDDTDGALKKALASDLGGAGGIAEAIVDAKGDLIVGDGADSVARLAVGTNGQVLTADSAEATGTKWTTPAGSGDMLAATYDAATVAEQLVGLTATQTLTNKTLTTPTITSSKVVPTTKSDTTSLDISAESFCTWTITGASKTVTITGEAASSSYQCLVVFANSGADAVTWSGVDVWVGGSAPTMVDGLVVSLWSIGTTVYGAAGQTAAELLALLLTVDGAGSGLDADTVDTYQASALLDRANHTGADVAIADGGTGASTAAAAVDALGGASSTGTGGLVRATSPTLVTPALGTPSALVGTNITGTAAGLTAGAVSDARLSAIAGLTMAADKIIYWTGATAAAATDLTTVARTLLGRATVALMRTDLEVSRFTSGAGTPSSTPTAKGNRYFDTTNNEDWVAIGTSSSADWRLVPRHKVQTTQAASTYTFVRGDGDSTVRTTGTTCTVTIPTNASVPFPIGTRINVYCSGTSATIDNLRLQGSPKRVIATDQALTVEKIASDTWLVMGGTS